MLCLHGYNADKTVMEFQIRHLKQIYEPVMDFVIIDGPFECIADPPQELARFMKAPDSKFRSWLTFKDFKGDSMKESPEVIQGLDTIIEYFTEVMNTQGPFDGVLGFSQGGIIYRHFWRLTQVIDPEPYKDKITLPKFLMAVGCPVFKNTSLDYKGETHPHKDE